MGSQGAEFAAQRKEDAEKKIGKRGKLDIR